MIIISRMLPFRGFTAVNLFGAVFVRKEAWEKLCPTERERVLVHEAIHTRQMRELLYIGFYALYFIEWVFRIIFHTKTAYKGISFEIEAYCHEDDIRYLFTREKYAMWRKNEPTQSI